MGDEAAGAGRAGVLHRFLWVCLIPRHSPFAGFRGRLRGEKREGGLGPHPAPKKTPDLSPSCRPVAREAFVHMEAAAWNPEPRAAPAAPPPCALNSQPGSSQINPQTQNLVCRGDTAAWAAAESRCGVQRGWGTERLGPHPRSPQDHKPTLGPGSSKLTFIKPSEALGPSGRSPQDWGRRAGRVEAGTGSLSHPAPTGRLHPHTQGSPSSWRARVVGHWLLGLEGLSLGAQGSEM